MMSLLLESFICLLRYSSIDSVFVLYVPVDYIIYIYCSSINVIVYFSRSHFVCEVAEKCFDAFLGCSDLQLVFLFYFLPHKLLFCIWYHLICFRYIYCDGLHFILVASKWAFFLWINLFVLYISTDIVVPPELYLFLLSIRIFILHCVCNKYFKLILCWC